MTKANIMKRAWEMYKNAGCTMRAEFAVALKIAWEESKAPKEYKNVIIASFDSYNQRRYSTPWVSEFVDGKHNFDKSIGGYTAAYNSGEAGDVYVSRPVDGKIYGYGQKDYRGGKTVINYAIFKNGKFIHCDKIGRIA